MEAQSHLVAAPGLVPTSPFQAGTYPSPHFPSFLFYTNFSLSLSETAGHFLNNALFVPAPRRRLRGVFQAEQLRLYPQIFLVQLIGPRSPNGPAGKQRKVKMLSRARCCTTPGAPFIDYIILRLCTVHRPRSCTLCPGVENWGRC